MRGRAVCWDLVSWRSCSCDGRGSENHRARSTGDRCLPLRLPCGLDDVTIRVAALDARVVRLVPLFDQLDASAARRSRSARTASRSRIPTPECIQGGGAILLSPTDRERESLRVVGHQDAVVVPPRRPGPEAEIGLVEAARALLVANGNREVVQRRQNARRRGHGLEREARSVAMRDERRRAWRMDQSRADALTGTIGARACTVSMISPLSMPCR